MEPTALITQKHLTIEIPELGRCFINLESVYKVHPDFVPKKIYTKMSSGGECTRVKYVKCKHAKEQLTKEQWEAIHSEVVYDWFKTQKDEHDHVRLILCKSKDVC